LVDDNPSWIVVAKGNEFLWPGYDLRKLPHSDRYDYGFLPAALLPIRCSTPSSIGIKATAAASRRANEGLMSLRMYLSKHGRSELLNLLRDNRIEFAEDRPLLTRSLLLATSW
jgi:hypothetical protein